jgi:hypothetical protein
MRSVSPRGGHWWALPRLQHLIFAIIANPTSAHLLRPVFCKKQSRHKLITESPDWRKSPGLRRNSAHIDLNEDSPNTSKMKTRIIALVCLVGISTVLCQKAVAQQETFGEAPAQPAKVSRPFYVSLLGQLALPQGDLKTYSNARGGFRIEAGKSFKKHPSLGGGAEFTAIFSGSKKDVYKGMEVKSNSSLYEIHPFVRWTPIKKQNLKPYFDISTGITVAYTSTDSKIVHAVPAETFIDQLLWGDDTKVETVSQKDNTSANLSFSIGTGVIIKKLLMVGIRYQHTNPVSYIDKSDVYIENNTIQYDVKRMPLDMIVVTVGISNWGSRK